MAEFDLVKLWTSSLGGGWNLYTAKWKELLPLTLLGFFGILLVRAAFLATSLGKDLPVMAIAAVISIVGSLAGAAVGFGLINRVNDDYEKKPMDASGYIGPNIIPAIVYMVFRIGIIIALGALFLIVFVPLAVVFGGVGLTQLAADGNGVISGNTALLAGLGIVLIIGIVVAIPLAIAAIILAFLIQFTEYEMAAGRKGVIEAAKSSIATVRANLVAVLVLGILFALAFVVIELPVAAVSFAAGFGNILLSATTSPSMGLVAEEVLNLPGYAYAALLMTPLELAILVKYWRVISGREPAELGQGQKTQP